MLKSKFLTIVIAAFAVVATTVQFGLVNYQQADAAKVGDCSAEGGSSNCSGGSGGRTVDEDGQPSAGGSGGHVVCDGSECTAQGGDGGRSRVVDEDGEIVGGEGGRGFHCEGDFDSPSIDCVGGGS
jgi:hypothetical protein